MSVEIEFFDVHKVWKHKNFFMAHCYQGFGGCLYYVRVPRRLREIVQGALYNGGCYIGVDSLSNIRCVLDDSRRIIFLDAGCKVTYKKNQITPLTRTIIF